MIKENNEESSKICKCDVCEDLNEEESERDLPHWVEREQERAEEHAETLRQWLRYERLRPCGCRHVFSSMHAHSCPRLRLSQTLGQVVADELRRLDGVFRKRARRAKPSFRM